MIIKGKTINLRKLKASDALPFSKHANDREVSLYTKIPHPYGMQDALDFIKSTHRVMRNGEAVKLGIELKETGEIVGVISLSDIDHVNKKAELSYWLAKPYWGKKIMKEAICLVLNFGFHELKLNKVYATVMHPNITSARLLENSYFQYEGKMRQDVFLNGQWLDHFLYSVLKDEFIVKFSNSNNNQ